MRHLWFTSFWISVLVFSMPIQAQEPALPTVPPTVEAIIQDANNHKMQMMVSSRPVAQGEKLTGTLVFVFAQNVSVPQAFNQDDLAEFVKKVHRNPQLALKVDVYTSADSHGFQINLASTECDGNFDVQGLLTSSPAEGAPQPPSEVTFIHPKTNDFEICIPEVEAGPDDVMVQKPNGASIDLHTQPWRFRSNELPILTLTIRHKNTDTCDEKKRALNPFDTACTEQYLLARNDAGNLVKIMQVHNEYLEIIKSSLNDSLHFAVNGTPPLDPVVGPFRLPILASSQDVWHINWFRDPLGCRTYNFNADEHGNVELHQPNPVSLADANFNYILVANAKIFDVALLQQMLNATAAQLGALSGFSPASITGAIGNFQGVARDTSYLAALVTTTPLPSITSANTAGQTGNAQTVMGSATPTQTSTTVTLQCPNGSLPTLGSSNTEGCSVPGTVANGATIPTTSTGTITNTATTTPGTTTQQTNGSQTSQQNQTQTSTTGVSGTVPTAPTSAPFSAPTNVGVSSADILTEQVELNAQITTLRLLLQGALSDQYVIRHTRPVATRKQTTLGFTISLDPPRQYKHAVAEVRILIVPPPGPDGVSIVNLLPAEKTYNVAKITSNQYAFGAGVAIAPVSVGVNTGKSKDRLFLAKDTDTLALQYPPPVTGAENIYTVPKDKSVIDDFWDLSELGDCRNAVRSANGDRDVIVGTNATVFGWQFRPVLGADYVRGGQRQVFVQLALPPGTSPNQPLDLQMFIQTRWRAYDPKRQIVGRDYLSSCSSAPDLSGLADTPILEVKSVDLADLGGGQLKLTNHGQFETASITVLAGTTNIVPLTSDGSTLQLFGNAHDLLEADPLTLLGPSGFTTSFGMKAKSKGCEIKSARLRAVPYPDGNSRMTLELQMGDNYRPNLNLDGPPQPLVLIGSQVYGLRETPFKYPTTDESTSPCQGTPSTCIYKFVAPTTDARNAQSFLVKDLHWENMSQKGTTDFYPLFSSLASLSSSASSSSPSSNQSGSEPCANGSKPKCPPKPVFPSSPTYLLVSGFDFDKLVENRASCKTPAPDTPCVDIWVGGLHDSPFLPISKNLATLQVDPNSLKIAKSIRFHLYSDTPPDQHVDEDSVEWDLAVPKADAPATITASPTFLRVSDSAPITFTGDKIPNIDPRSVRFDGQTTLTAQLSADSQSLTVYVTTAVTMKPGHKVLTANAAGSTQPVQLPFDVFK
jgi:hypothetical protein